MCSEIHAQIIQNGGAQKRR